jgi:hypothetical protein
VVVRGQMATPKADKHYGRTGDTQRGSDRLAQAEAIQSLGRVVISCTPRLRCPRNKAPDLLGTANIHWIDPKIPARKFGPHK